MCLKIYLTWTVLTLVPKMLEQMTEDVGTSTSPILCTLYIRTHSNWFDCFSFMLAPSLCWFHINLILIFQIHDSTGSPASTNVFQNFLKFSTFGIHQLLLAVLNKKIYATSLSPFTLRDGLGNGPYLIFVSFSSWKSAEIARKQILQKT